MTLAPNFTAPLNRTVQNHFLAQLSILRLVTIFSAQAALSMSRRYISANWRRWRFFSWSKLLGMWQESAWGDGRTIAPNPIIDIMTVLCKASSKDTNEVLECGSLVVRYDHFLPPPTMPGGQEDDSARPPSRRFGGPSFCLCST